MSVYQKDSSACYDNISVSVLLVLRWERLSSTSLSKFTSDLISKLFIVYNRRFKFSTHILYDFYLEWSLYESEQNTFNHLQDNFKLKIFK